MNHDLTKFECSVVTYLLNDHNEFNPELQQKHFANRSCGIIWEAANKIISERKPADIFTVCEILGDSWSKTILEVMEIGRSSTPKTFYIDEIKKAYRKREMQRIISECESPEQAIEQLLKLDDTKNNYTYTMKECVKAAINQLDLINCGEIKTGILTGISRYDQLTGGFHNTDLIVIGARSGVGKTALLIKILLNNIGVILFASSEQGHLQIGQRSLAIKGQVPLDKMRNAKYQDHEWDSISRAGTELVNSQVVVYDYSKPTVADIAREARKLKITTGITMVAVDYIQRLRPAKDSFSKKQAVAEIVQDLKSLAKELNVPVIALSQLNRNAHDRVPALNDLSDATEIEMESDVVLLIHREAVYNESADPTKAELIIAKNRSGETGHIPLHWTGKTITYRGY